MSDSDGSTSGSISVQNNTGQDLKAYSARRASKAQAKEGDAGIEFTFLADLPAGTTKSIAASEGSQVHVVYSGTASELGSSPFYRIPVKLFYVQADENDALVASVKPGVAAASSTVDVVSDDFTAAGQMRSFLQQITVQPTSDMAQGFLTANKANDRGNAVDKFFQTAKDFEKCGFYIFLAMQIWQDTYFSAWQGSYYLYNKTSDNQLITSVAVVTIPASSDSDGAVLQTTDKYGSTDGQPTANLSRGGSGDIVGAGSDAVDLSPFWMIDSKGKALAGLAAVKSGMTGKIAGNVVTGSQDTINLSGEKTADKVASVLKSPWYQLATTGLSQLEGLAGLVVNVGFLIHMIRSSRTENAAKDGLPGKVSDKVGDTITLSKTEYGKLQKDQIEYGKTLVDSVTTRKIEVEKMKFEDDMEEAGIDVSVDSQEVIDGYNKLMRKAGRGEDVSEEWNDLIAKNRSAIEEGSLALNDGEGEILGNFLDRMEVVGNERQASLEEIEPDPPIETGGEGGSGAEIG